MPNWCSCSVTIDCSAELFNEICAYVRSEDNVFDFDKIIPMPETLKNEPGLPRDRAIAYCVTERLTIPVEQTNLSELISNLFSSDWAHEVVAELATWAETASDEDKNELYASGKQYMYNKENYGSFDWYDWRIESWGTKWNSENASLHETSFVFETAWNPCTPVISALAAQFPATHIRFDYTESGWGFCGAIEYLNGVPVYMLTGDYYEIWPEDNEDETCTNIDEEKLPLSDKATDFYLDIEEKTDNTGAGKLYYREKIDDEYIVEIIGEVAYTGNPPEHFWNE